MTTPTVSVVMPVYNQAWIAHRAAQSLARQTFRDFELIVVDDGSTDGLDADEVARTAGTRDYAALRRGRPGGSAAKAINAGTAFAQAPYWTWVSADNLMTPDWLETLVAELERGAGAVYGGFWFVPATRVDVEDVVGSKVSIDAVETHWRQRFRGRYLFEPHEPGKQIEREDCYYGPAFLTRREVWTSHEGGASHDLGWWLRVEDKCHELSLPIWGVNRGLCWYLAHDQRCVIRQPNLYDSKEQLASARRRRDGGGEAK